MTKHAKKRSRKRKTREVIFNITVTDPDDENFWEEGEIVVIFTGKIKPGLCINTMYNGLKEAIHQNGPELIMGKYIDMILSR